MLFKFKVNGRRFREDLLRRRKVNMGIYKNYKDRVFRLLFKDRRRLLELYNALNGTNYDNVEDLEVTTLENAIFIKMKN